MSQPSNSRRMADEGGFTLIELLVVIIILGILAAVVVFAVGGISDKGQTNACRIDTRTLRTAEEAYAASPQGNGNYLGSDPTSEQTLVNGGFLSDSSSLHYVTLKDPDGAGPLTMSQGFDVRIQDAKCGGTPGDLVDPAAKRF